jgi:hypothetical protein
MKHTKLTRAMKLRYIYILFTLVPLLYFAPAHAQTKKTAKKTAKKTVSKAPPKKTAKAVTQQKSEAKKIGDAIAKTNTAPAPTTDTVKNNSITEQIVVTTAYKPVLADAVKIRRNPDLEDVTPYKAPLTYNIIDVRLNKDNEIKQLEARKMPRERDSVPANNYAEVGVGNLKTTYGEGYFYTGPDPALQAGAFVKHFGQQGSLYKQNEDKNEVNVFAKSIGASNDMSGFLDYKYNTNYFYGYNPVDSSSHFTPAKQHFSLFSGRVDLVKHFADSADNLSYAFKLTGYAYSDAFHAREVNQVFSGYVNQNIQQFHVGLAASLDLSTQKDSLYDLNNSLIRLNPYIKLEGDNYKINAGINIVDQFGFASKFYLFPAAQLEYQVVPKYVRLFAELKGDVNKTSIMDLTTINPFMGPNIKIENSVDQLDISVGLKGTIAPGFGFKAFIFRNSVKDMPLIVSNFGRQGNKFAVVYDNGDSRINGLTGDVDYKASDDVDIFGRVEFKDYQMAQQAQAWNLPKFKLTAGTIIHINNKVDINGSLLFRGNTQDISFAGALNPLLKVTPTGINSFADLSGGVTYKATKKISVFVKANNILNTTNQAWLYYPDYGFNIFGGVGFAF